MCGPTHRSFKNDWERALVSGLIAGEKLNAIASRHHYSHSNASMTLSRMRDRFGVETSYELVIALVREGVI